jgi:hypothetical protein
MSKLCDEKAGHKACDKVVLNVEKSFWQKLDFWTNLRTRLHLMICKNCSDYKKDSTVIHRILCSLNKDKSTNNLQADELQKIKKALQ